MKNCGLRAVCLAMVGLFVLCGGVAYSQSTSNQGLPWDGLIKLSAGSVGSIVGIAGEAEHSPRPAKIIPSRLKA